MPGIQSVQGDFPRTEQLSKRIQELKARAAEGLEEAMGVVEKNLGRREAGEAVMSLGGLGEELSAQETASHRLDPMRVADLISDPFEDD
ncbi:MAG: hypothetical protein JEY79_14580 [Pseudodesulfovibrio sp.]|jgi:hypothetical protein|nr:hypothetical protein [Pseudodesulfovibrio sp.]